jgi:hypothetical protein
LSKAAVAIAIAARFNALRGGMGLKSNIRGAQRVQIEKVQLSSAQQNNKPHATRNKMIFLLTVPPCPKAFEKR